VEWVMLIIPAVAVAIWAIRTAMEKGAEPNRNLPPQGRPAGRPRSASAEIDRFLEEVNRRRQEQQRQARRPVEPPPARPVTVEIEPTPPSRARPVYRPRPAVPPPVRRPIPEPVVLAVAEPVIPEVIAAPTVANFTSPTMAPQPPRVSRPVPPYMQELSAMLRSPKSVRTAFVLTEVFGKPLSRRRR